MAGEEFSEVTGEHFRGSQGKVRRVVRESKMSFSCSKYLKWNAKSTSDLVNRNTISCWSTPNCWTSMSGSAFQGDIIACGVLSGTKNFEGCLCDCVRANYLASPPLVVAYAIAGTVQIDFDTEPLGECFPTVSVSAAGAHGHRFLHMISAPRANTFEEKAQPYLVCLCLKQSIHLTYQILCLSGTISAGLNIYTNIF